MVENNSDSWLSKEDIQAVADTMKRERPGKLAKRIAIAIESLWTGEDCKFIDSLHPNRFKAVGQYYTIATREAGEIYFDHSDKSLPPIPRARRGTDLTEALQDLQTWCARVDAIIREADSSSEERSQSILRVDVDRTTVYFPNKSYGVTERQAQIVQKLLEARGGWLNSTDLKVFKDSCERPDRVIKALPEPVRGLIESKVGMGFRIPPEKTTRRQ